VFSVCVCKCVCAVCVVPRQTQATPPTFLLIGLYELRVSDLQEEALVLLVFFVINYPDFYCFAGRGEKEKEGEEEKSEEKTGQEKKKKER